jgi:hypothetical protein
MSMLYGLSNKSLDYLIPFDCLRIRRFLLFHNILEIEEEIF